MTPLDRIVSVRVDQAAPDGGVGEQEFEVVLRDPDVGDDLHARVWVDDRPGARAPISVEEGDVPRNADDPTRATWRFRISFSSLPAGACHKIDLLVSRGYDDAPRDRQPAIPGDLGATTWWVKSTSTLAPTVGMDTCP